MLMNNDFTPINRGRKLAIHLLLKSDTTLGRGDGVAGIIDAEVEHDSNGLPFLRGRTLKGLLNEECANLLYALQPAGLDQGYHDAAMRLFGGPGSDLQSNASVRYGDAQLPAAIRQVVEFEMAVVRAEKKLAERGTPVAVKRRTPALQPTDFLNSLTAIRRQTALDEMGVPVKASLRTMRVLLRETPLISAVAYQPPSHLSSAASERDLVLLAAVCRAFRRMGTGRNRGRGRVVATLHDEAGVDITDPYMARFAQSLNDSPTQGRPA
jgi:hypothetical protein